MAYQGSFWHWDMPLTGLDWRLFNWRQLEFHNRVNFLKSGLVFSDLLSTVSPTYAHEIQTPDFGCGFDGLLRARRHDLYGIVNGIDATAWNPRGRPAPRRELRRRHLPRRQARLQGRAPTAAPACPSVPTSPSSPRSAGSTRRRGGTC